MSVSKSKKSAWICQCLRWLCREACLQEEWNSCRGPIWCETAFYAVVSWINVEIVCHCYDNMLCPIWISIYYDGMYYTHSTKYVSSWCVGLSSYATILTLGGPLKLNNRLWRSSTVWSTHSRWSACSSTFSLCSLAKRTNKFSQP